MKRTIAALALAATAMACGTGTEGTTVDGWKLGAVQHCTDPDPHRPCSVLLPLARARLDVRDAGHSPVVGSELRIEDWNTQIQNARSTPIYVAVFTLADGERKAIGVLYPGIATEPTTVDYGP